MIIKEYNNRPYHIFFFHVFIRGVYFAKIEKDYLALTIILHDRVRSLNILRNAFFMEYSLL